MKTGKLGKYSWVIDENEWTTLYIGSPDPSNSNTIFDGFVTCDPEEAILKSIIKAERLTRYKPKQMKTGKLGKYSWFCQHRSSKQLTPAET
jgi:hypothetical protein